MKASEVLDRARALLTPPGAWTQGCVSRLADGWECFLYHPDVTSRCMMGAVRAACEQAAWTQTHYERARGYLQKATHTDIVAKWNDAPARTVKEVLAALKQAAALAREAGE